MCGDASGRYLSIVHVSMVWARILATCAYLKGDDDSDDLVFGLWEIS